MSEHELALAMILTYVLTLSAVAVAIVLDRLERREDERYRRELERHGLDR